MSAALSSQGTRRPRIALLLGKPPQRSPVLPEVIEALRASDAVVQVHVPRDDAPLPDDLAHADTVGLRGLSRGVLTSVVEAERRGVRCCNPASATLLALDRAAVHRRLSDAGVVVPAATTVEDAGQAREWAAGRPVVVKTVDAHAGLGTGVVLWDDPARGRLPPVPGPYLVQAWVPGDGVDRKVYVAGVPIGGLRKQRAAGRRTGTPFEPGARLAEAARTVGQALGLRLFGVDLVEGPDGPVVVDVNAFPSCAGVPGAAGALARALLDCARRG